MMSTNDVCVSRGHGDVVFVSQEGMVTMMSTSDVFVSQEGMVTMCLCLKRAW